MSDIVERLHQLDLKAIAERTEAAATIERIEAKAIEAVTRWAEYAAELRTEIDRLTFALSDARMEIATLRDALKPFAAVGQLIDSPFGPALFADDDAAFKSGCAWSENGEKKSLTWGDFRRAALAKARQQ